MNASTYDDKHTHDNTYYTTVHGKVSIYRNNNKERVQPGAIKRSNCKTWNKKHLHRFISENTENLRVISEARAGLESCVVPSMSCVSKDECPVKPDAETIFKCPGNLDAVKLKRRGRGKTAKAQKQGYVSDFSSLKQNTIALKAAMQIQTRIGTSSKSIGLGRQENQTQVEERPTFLFISHPSWACALTKHLQTDKGRIVTSKPRVVTSVPPKMRKSTSRKLGTHLYV